MSNDKKWRLTIKAFELILYAPKSFIPCKWKTAKANSIQEFADICDNDQFTIGLLNSGWTIATMREVK